MTAEDDIAFLESFREKITAFLIAGTAPTQDPLWGGSGLTDFEEAMKDPAFRALRQEINRMKGRAAQILEEFSINCTFTQYPPPAVGGPVTKFPLFNLITDNQSLHTIDGSLFTDKIDEAIGLLEATSAASTSESAIPIFEVRDLETALEFYASKLGFTPEPEAMEHGFAFVSFGEVRILLLASGAPHPAKALIKSNRTDYAGRLQPIEGHSQNRVTLGDIECLVFTDPDGNQLLFKDAE